MTGDQRAAAYVAGVEAARDWYEHGDRLAVPLAEREELADVFKLGVALELDAYVTGDTDADDDAGGS